MKILQNLNIFVTSTLFLKRRGPNVTLFFGRGASFKAGWEPMI